MDEFIIPDDGLMVRTADGRPIVELAVHEEGSVVRLFSVEGEPKLAFATHEDTGLIVVGNPETSGIAISVNPATSEIALMNSGKNVTLAINATHSEMRFVNSDGVVTNKIYIDDDGGQVGLADHNGNLLLSAGAEPSGGSCHLMNTNGETVVLLQSNEDAGNITLLDSAAKIRIMIGHKDDANIHLVDGEGRIRWTTMSS